MAPKNKKPSRNAQAPHPSSAQAQFLLSMAFDAHRGGRLAEAERLFRTVLQGEPRQPDALTMLGVIHLQKGQPRDAAVFLTQAVQVRPDYAAWFNLAQALGAIGNAAQAADALTHAADLNPGDGSLLLAAAQSWMQAGQVNQALACLRRCAQAHPTHPALHNALRQLLENTVFHAADPVLLQALAALPGEKPRWYGQRLTNLLTYDPSLAPLLASPPPASADALPRFAPLLTCRPLRDLLAEDLVPDTGFERLLINARSALVQAVAASHPLDADAQAFLVALALHGQASEFAWIEDAPGLTAAQSLLTRIDGLLPLAAVGCYLPLAKQSQAREWLKTFNHSDDTLAAQLLRRTLADPLREEDIKPAVPDLTALENPVSKAVAAQYDENPYPRWFTLPDMQVRPFAEAIKARFSQTDFTPESLTPRHILVAGSGSGYHAFQVARRHPDADILAIDLSRANLAHALRAQEQNGITNIRFARADILELGRLDQRFDLIESTGVLHHLADPLAGWRVLTDLLAPGGLMHIALYSTIARRPLDAAAALAQEMECQASASCLRRFRAAVIDLPADHQARRMVRSREFYALSSLRDLAFHAQEHRFTCLGLKDALKQLGLDFLGFQNPPLVDRQYRAAAPEDRGQTDLESWHRFEEANPNSFTAMYDFWCRKPPGQG